jgi:hypothetical protein
VFWLGNQTPTDSDLEPFLVVRKNKVLAALRYLVQYNPLYRDITINHSEIDGWADEFIPEELQDHIICLTDTDHHERAGYTVNLQDHNYENDWQAAEDDVSNPAANAPLMTGSVATDINGERQNPDVRMLNAVYHLKNAQPDSTDGESLASYHPQRVQPQSQSARIPALRYAIQGQAILLSHWEDTHYFLSAFPTLFPTGVGGHLDNRPIPVSPAAYADWALRHHSRRQVSWSNWAE